MTVGRIPNIEGGIQPTLLTTTGDIMYASSASNPARLGIGSSAQVLTVASGVPSWATPTAASITNDTATVATSQSTTSTSFTDLTTAGPAVTVTTGTKVLVIVTAQVTNAAATPNTLARMDFGITGATTRAATNATAYLVKADTNGDVTGRASTANIVTVTAGSNTFTAKYSTSSAGAACTFADRSILVINLGS